MPENVRSVPKSFDGKSALTYVEEDVTGMSRKADTPPPGCAGSKLPMRRLRVPSPLSTSAIATPGTVSEPPSVAGRQRGRCRHRRHVRGRGRFAEPPFQRAVAAIDDLQRHAAGAAGRQRRGQTLRGRRQRRDRRTADVDRHRRRRGREQRAELRLPDDRQAVVQRRRRVRELAGTEPVELQADRRRGAAIDRGIAGAERRRAVVELDRAVALAEHRLERQLVAARIEYALVSHAMPLHDELAVRRLAERRVEHTSDAVRRIQRIPVRRDERRIRGHRRGRQRIVEAVHEAGVLVEADRALGGDAGGGDEAVVQIIGEAERERHRHVGADLQRAQVGADRRDVDELRRRRARFHAVGEDPVGRPGCVLHGPVERAARVLGAPGQPARLRLRADRERHDQRQREIPAGRHEERAHRRDQAERGVAELVEVEILAAAVVHERAEHGLVAGRQVGAGRALQARREQIGRIGHAADHRGQRGRALRGHRAGSVGGRYGGRRRECRDQRARDAAAGCDSYRLHRALPVDPAHRRCRGSGRRSRSRAPDRYAKLWANGDTIVSTTRHAAASGCRRSRPPPTPALRQVVETHGKRGTGRDRRRTSATAPENVAGRPA
ncbi:MAG TPA: hypothetical protein VMR06_03285 [Dokdonella sp.]|uniref:hypothetical protein n=1 Tax=Dokdonella sp. TaxID=2291710 RepID=UPI002C6E629C|nr:hypothetical protein [Dokdonella sp.]HUD41002.1 hypothetical protein [Dokdonella sp.]